MSIAHRPAGDARENVTITLTPADGGATVLTTRHDGSNGSKANGVGRRAVGLPLAR